MRAFGALLTAGLVVVPLASAATFGRPAEVPLAQAPTAITAFDATQDGIEDVVVANAAAPILTVLAGKEDGAFEQPLELGSGPAPRSVAVADFDNDGGDDLAVAGGNEIAIYTSSDATLVRGTALTASSVSTVVAADLDLDGNIDLLAGAQNQPVVTVFPGVGDGTFLQGQEYAAGRAAASFFVADLDGDELPDVVVGGNGVSVLIGNGDGTLSPPVSLVDASGTSALTGDDLDSDGDVDLAAARRPNIVDVLLNDGAGQFAAAGSLRVGGTPVAIRAAYIDDDGLLDLVTANRGTNDVSVLLGLGDGQFGPESRVRVGKGPVGMAIEDLDSEGSNDLVTANRVSKSVTILLNGVDAPQPVVCLVPALARRKLAVARRLVSAAHCNVAALRRKYSRRVKKGRVISVSPVPGTRRPIDTPVTLLVSRGPKPRRG